MNRYADHVYVIPEDRADQQIADGFVNHHKVKDARIKVMPVAGGWPKVLDTFQVEYIKALREFPKAHVVMLIDFDGNFEQRRVMFEQAIPEDLKARVFVVGPKHTPEVLKIAVKKRFEEIGTCLGDDCDANTTALWGHEELSHNDADRLRLVQTVKPFLF